MVLWNTRASSPRKHKKELQNILLGILCTPDSSSLTRKGLGNNLARKCFTGMQWFLPTSFLDLQLDWSGTTPFFKNFLALLCCIIPIISGAQTPVGWRGICSLINTNTPAFKTLPGKVIFSSPFLTWPEGSGVQTSWHHPSVCLSSVYLRSWHGPWPPPYLPTTNDWNRRWQKSGSNEGTIMTIMGLA